MDPIMEKKTTIPNRSRTNYTNNPKKAVTMQPLTSRQYEKGEVDVSGGELNEYVHEPLPTLVKKIIPRTCQ